LDKSVDGEVDERPVEADVDEVVQLAREEATEQPEPVEAAGEAHQVEEASGQPVPVEDTQPEPQQTSEQPEPVGETKPTPQQPPEQPGLAEEADEVPQQPPQPAPQQTTPPQYNYRGKGRPKFKSFPLDHDYRDRAPP